MAGRIAASSMARDLYQVLGVKPDASHEAIKRAYRRLVKRYHPDLNKQRGAKEMFLEVKEAYEVLSNPLLRREYDERASGERSRPAETWEPRPGAPRKVRVPSAYVRVNSPFGGYRDCIDSVRDRSMARRARVAQYVWRAYVVTVVSMSGVLGLSSASLLASGSAFSG